MLERFTFSSINLNVDIPELALKPQIEGQALTWNRNQTEPVSQRIAKEKGLSASLWQVGWLPEGFALVAEQSRRKAHNDKVVEQRVYSDGLSSVSVFIEQKTAAHHHLEGGSRMGAINAFGLVEDNHYITAVGQVPGHTVEKIGRSITMQNKQQ